MFVKLVKADTQNTECVIFQKNTSPNNKNGHKTTKDKANE